MMVTMDPREHAGGIAPVVEVTGATVRFGAETVLEGVDFRLFPGEVHSLMGENGAGKSTLIRALTGVLHLDAGVIRVGGERAGYTTPAGAIAAGISTVYQEIDLLPNLTVAENICLGREPRRFGAVDWRAMVARAREALADLGVDIDPQSVLATHSLAVQQLVAIARAVSIDAKVLVLDEPTSSLDLDEVAELFRVMRELTQRGSRSSSSRTSSTRCTRSATGSRCSAAAASSASTCPRSSCGWAWSRRCSAGRRRRWPSTTAAKRRSQDAPCWRRRG